MKQTDLPCLQKRTTTSPAAFPWLCCEYTLSTVSLMPALGLTCCLWTVSSPISCLSIRPWNSPWLKKATGQQVRVDGTLLLPVQPGESPIPVISATIKNLAVAILLGTRINDKFFMGMFLSESKIASFDSAGRINMYCTRIGSRQIRRTKSWGPRQYNGQNWSNYIVPLTYALNTEVPCGTKLPSLSTILSGQPLSPATPIVYLISPDIEHKDFTMKYKRFYTWDSRTEKNGRHKLTAQGRAIQTRLRWSGYVWNNNYLSFLSAFRPHAWAIAKSTSWTIHIAEGAEVVLFIVWRAYYRRRTLGIKVVC